MEQEKQKDNFWLIIGGLIVAVIIGVIIFKSREMSSVSYSGYDELKQEVDKQIAGAKQ